MYFKSTYHAKVLPSFSNIILFLKSKGQVDTFRVAQCLEGPCPKKVDANLRRLGLKRHYSKLSINYTACIRDWGNVEDGVEKGASKKNILIYHPEKMVSGLLP